MTKGERIAEEFRSSGQSQSVRCSAKGINRATLRHWLERSEELSEGKEIHFARIVEGGEEEC